MEWQLVSLPSSARVLSETRIHCNLPVHPTRSRAAPSVIVVTHCTNKLIISLFFSKISEQTHYYPCDGTRQQAQAFEFSDQPSLRMVSTLSPDKAAFRWSLWLVCNSDQAADPSLSPMSSPTFPCSRILTAVSSSRPPTRTTSRASSQMPVIPGPASSSWARSRQGSRRFRRSSSPRLRLTRRYSWSRPQIFESPTIHRSSARSA